MITLGEIVRRYAAQYRAQYGDQMLPSQHSALSAIAQCRTAALGGHVYSCPDCGTTRYSYHSCRNRHCPLCQQGDAQRWLEQQHDLLLPVPYFLITFTLPSELREIAYRHQRQFYSLFFQSSASALQQLAADVRFGGGKIGMLGVLQTWTRDLRYHPHIHYLVPAIGLAADGRFCRPRNPGFLMPVQALAVLFRAKLRAALCQTDYAASIPASVSRSEPQAKSRLHAGLAAVMLSRVGIGLWASWMLGFCRTVVTVRGVSPLSGYFSARRAKLVHTAPSKSTEPNPIRIGPTQPARTKPVKNRKTATLAGMDHSANERRLARAAWR